MESRRASTRGQRRHAQVGDDEGEQHAAASSAASSDEEEAATARRQKKLKKPTATGKTRSARERAELAKVCSGSMNGQGGVSWLILRPCRRPAYSKVDSSSRSSRWDAAGKASALSESKQLIRSSRTAPAILRRPVLTLETTLLTPAMPRPLRLPPFRSKQQLEQPARRVLRMRTVQLQTGSKDQPDIKNSFIAR